jgi:CRISPR-associated endonuclease/helicase Cas3
LNRQQYFINLTPQTIDSIVESVDLIPNKSYLFILNTISSAKQLYDTLKTKYDEKIGFLSTHIIPKERLNRINDIKNKKYRIVVSTQLVEAGVVSILMWYIET